MKTLLPALILFALGTIAWSQGTADIQLTKGTTEIILNGDLDVDSLVGTTIDLELGLGQFVKDYVELGGRLDFNDSDFITRYGLHGFGEYNHDTLTYWIPFAGASLGYEFFEAENIDVDESGLVVGLYGGFKYFFPGYNNLAWAGQVGIDWASAELFDEEDGVGDVDLKFQMGLRYLMPK